MNKNIICALVLGSTLSCNTPVETKPNGEKAIYIPRECVKTLSLVHNEQDANWSLTCKNTEENEIFYERNNSDEHWRRYEIVRQ